jgi:hypothetical protein
MPSITKELLLKLKDQYKNYSTFLETGTYKGETIFAMEPYFDNLITVEINENLFNSVSNSASNSASNKLNKIKFINADSIDIFQHIFKIINDKIIFFLDAHYSAIESSYGTKPVALLDELELINKLYKNDGIIIIGDVRLFGKNMGDENWTDISTEKIFTILFDRINDYYYLESNYSKEDFLIVHIKGINE